VLFVRDPDVELFRFEVPAASLPPPPPPDFAEKKSPRWVRPITKFGAWTQRWPRPLRWVVLVLAVAAVAAAAFGVVRLLRGDDVAPAQFPTVDPGAVGAEVTAAQHLLTDHGMDVDVTGFFDDDTTAATRQFEEQAGIVADGILGPLTWSELVVTLQPGSDRDAVRAAQVLLNDNGAAVAVDGLFGPRTRNAVITFEQANGLHVDGIVDDDVWKHLLAQSAE
jgi:peptidoglycan hydrolase-like protein with peptidoglycan-binding domain